MVQRKADSLAEDGKSSDVVHISPAIITAGQLLHGIVVYDRKKSPIHPSKTYVVHYYVIAEEGDKARFFKGSYDLTLAEAMEEFEKRAAIVFPQYDRPRDTVK